MGHARFDATDALEFDLARGSVQGSGERLMLVPSALFEEIAVSASPAAAMSVARAVGASCGRRVVSRLGDVETARGLPIDVVVSHLGGELALSGLGSLSVERWGRALVVIVSGSSVRDDGVLAALVEGALGVVAGRSVYCLPAGRTGDSVRVFVSSETAVEKARQLLAGGLSLGEALTKVQARGDA